MVKFNSCIHGANVQLKSFPGCKTMQLDHHTIPILQEQYYDAAGIHVGRNDLLNSSSKKSIDEICVRNMSFTLLIMVLFPNVTSGKMAFTCWKLEKSLLQITSLVALIIF